MILYKQSMSNGKVERKGRILPVNIDELPVRNRPKYNTPKEREKHIKSVETIVRRSLEYKSYIKFLKDHLDMKKCLVLKNLKMGNGKRYHVEIHHEPFTLFDIVETVINKNLYLDKSIGLLEVGKEVMELHYDGKVGLIPLTSTMHELVHSGRIFIPLQFIYQKYNNFFNEYEQFINPNTLEKLEAKVNLSLDSDSILSDSLDVEFTYLDVDGFKFPKVPEDWKNVLGNNIQA